MNMSEFSLGSDMEGDVFLPVACVKLNENNYLAWKAVMEAFIKSKGLMDVVTGKETEPGTGASESERKLWNMKQNKVLFWILSSVTEGMMVHILNSKTAKEAWDELANLHHNRTKANETELINELYRLKKGSMSMYEYITKIKSICCTLQSISVSSSIIGDDKQVQIALNGLEGVYAPLRYTACEPKQPTFSELICRLLMTEGRARGLENYDESQEQDADGGYANYDENQEHCMQDINGGYANYDESQEHCVQDTDGGYANYNESQEHCVQDTDGGIANYDESQYHCMQDTNGGYRRRPYGGGRGRGKRRRQ